MRYKTAFLAFRIKNKASIEDGFQLSTIRVQIYNIIIATQYSSNIQDYYFCLLPRLLSRPVPRLAPYLVPRPLPYGSFFPFNNLAYYYYSSYLGLINILLSSLIRRRRYRFRRSSRGRAYSSLGDNLRGNSRGSQGSS